MFKCGGLTEIGHPLLMRDCLKDTQGYELKFAHRLK